MIKRLVVSEGREELTVEGNDLLLNSERGAGGVVVSKEEVAVGRKGSGGAWGSTSRNAGQPRKMVEYEHRRKKQRNIRSSGCRLQVGGVENDLLAIRLQNPMTLFSAARTSNSRCLVLSALFSLKMRCA